jgi:hypothetical protein
MLGFNVNARRPFQKRKVIRCKKQSQFTGMFDDLLRTGFGLAQREVPPASYQL